VLLHPVSTAAADEGAVLPIGTLPRPTVQSSAGEERATWHASRAVASHAADVRTLSACAASTASAVTAAAPEIEDDAAMAAAIFCCLASSGLDRCSGAIVRNGRFGD
jgi:hypothetical protein